jgi:KaiC/GvpD/RAD55 family RecA-like ATPase
MLTGAWPIPLGSVAVCAGAQGIGKSVISCALASDVTRQGHGVIFLAEEDAAEAVVLPRCEAAGVDLARVFTIEATRSDDFAGVLLPRDTVELADLAAAHDVRLLVVDPWSNHLDGIDVDKGAVRNALMPIVRVAREANLVVLLIAHPVKRDTGDPLTTIAHASAVTQVARSAFFVLVDPERGVSDPRHNPHRLVCHVKANLTSFRESLRYSIQPTLLPAIDHAPEASVPRAIHTGSSELGYLDARARLRREEPHEGGEPRTKTGRTRQWLHRFLKERGPTRKPEVIRAGEAAGHAARTVERVYREIGVPPYREDGEPATTNVLWAITPDTQHEGETGGSDELDESGETREPSGD